MFCTRKNTYEGCFDRRWETVLHNFVTVWISRENLKEKEECKEAFLLKWWSRSSHTSKHEAASMAKPSNCFFSHSSWALSLSKGWCSLNWLKLLLTVQKQNKTNYSIEIFLRCTFTFPCPLVYLLHPVFSFMLNVKMKLVVHQSYNGFPWVAIPLISLTWGLKFTCNHGSLSMRVLTQDAEPSQRRASKGLNFFNNHLPSDEAVMCWSSIRPSCIPIDGELQT